MPGRKKGWGLYSPPLLYSLTHSGLALNLNNTETNQQAREPTPVLLSSTRWCAQRHLSASILFLGLILDCGVGLVRWELVWPLPWAQWYCLFTHGTENVLCAVKLVKTLFGLAISYPRKSLIHCKLIFPFGMNELWMNEWMNDFFHHYIWKKILESKVLKT